MAHDGPGPEHANVNDVQEHGRDWEVCDDCGAQWNADGEQVSVGDGWCLDNAEEV